MLLARVWDWRQSLFVAAIGLFLSGCGVRQTLIDMRYARDGVDALAEIKGFQPARRSSAHVHYVYLDADGRTTRHGEAKIDVASSGLIPPTLAIRAIPGTNLSRAADYDTLATEGIFFVGAVACFIGAWMSRPGRPDPDQT